MIWYNHNSFIAIKKLTLELVYVSTVAGCSTDCRNCSDFGYFTAFSNILLVPTGSLLQHVHVLFSHSELTIGQHKTTLLSKSDTFPGLTISHSQLPSIALVAAEVHGSRWDFLGTALRGEEEKGRKGKTVGREERWKGTAVSGIYDG